MRLESYYQIGNGRLLRILPYPALFGAAVRALFVWVALYVTVGLIRSVLHTLRDFEQRKHT